MILKNKRRLEGISPITYISNELLACTNPSDKSIVNIWDLNKVEIVKTIQVPDETSLEYLHYNQNSNLLYLDAMDMGIYDLKNDKFIKVLRCREIYNTSDRGLYYTKLSKNGKYLVYYREEEEVRILDPLTGETLKEYIFNDREVLSVDISNDSRYLLVSLSYPHKCDTSPKSIIIDLETNEEVLSLQFQSYPFSFEYCRGVLINDKYIYYGIWSQDTGESYHLYNKETGKWIKKLDYLGERARYSETVSSDNKYFFSLTRNSNNKMCLEKIDTKDWSIDTRELLELSEGYDELKFSPDNKQIALEREYIDIYDIEI